MWAKHLSMNCRWRSYEHEVSHFFLQRFISTARFSISLSSFLKQICLDGISSLTKNTITFPFPFLSILYGGLNLSIRKWPSGKVSSNYFWQEVNVSNLLRKELKLRWPIANLFILFNFKGCRISSRLSSKFWFSDCSLNCRFWETDVSASFGLTVTDETKSVAWILSINRHKLRILLIKLIY